MSYAIGLTLPKERFQETDSSFRMIAVAVVLLHLFFIGFVSMHAHHVPVPLKPAQKLIVKTITINEGKSIQVKSSKVHSKASVEPASEAVVSEKKAVEPEPKVEKETSRETEVPKTLEKEKVSSKTPAVAKEPLSVSKTKKITKSPPKIAAKSSPKAKPKPVVKKEPIKKSVPEKKTTPNVEKKPSVKKAKPVKEPEVLAKAAQKTTTPQKTTVDPQAAALKSKQRELIAQAKASLSKVGKTASALSGTNTLAAVSSSKIESLSVDALADDLGMSVREIGYRNELASLLRMLLKLPEHGAVKIKLKLERAGKLLSMSIVHTENAVNRKYIEKVLPTLTFPAFGSNFSGHQDYTFLITLSNEL